MTLFYETLLFRLVMFCLGIKENQVYGESAEFC